VQLRLAVGTLIAERPRTVVELGLLRDAVRSRAGVAAYGEYRPLPFHLCVSSGAFTQMTRHLMPHPRRAQQRLLRPTNIHHERTARVKAAARRRIERARDVAGQARAAPAAAVLRA
jgi:hypothetical protein